MGARARSSAAAEPAPAPEASFEHLPNTRDSAEARALRNAACLALAAAAHRLFPGTRMGSWELADYGFHCDLATPSPLSDKDLGRLTKEAQRLARLQLPIGVEKISLADANRLLEERDEKFLLDALHQGRDAGEASGALLIRLGERGAKDSWWTVLPASEVDLPQSTVALSTASLSLEAVSGCYWRGDESRPQLSRVGGSVWATAAQLAAYTHLRAEALARDHRRLGAQLDLFSVDDRAGVGLVLWHPRGAIIRHLMEAFWKDMHLNNGYELLYTPHIAKVRGKLMDACILALGPGASRSSVPFFLPRCSGSCGTRADTRAFTASRCFGRCRWRRRSTSCVR